MQRDMGEDASRDEHGGPIVDREPCRPTEQKGAGYPESTPTLKADVWQGEPEDETGDGLGQECQADREIETKVNTRLVHEFAFLSSIVESGDCIALTASMIRAMREEIVRVLSGGCADCRVWEENVSHGRGCVGGTEMTMDPGFDIYTIGGYPTGDVCVAKVGECVSGENPEGK